MVIVNVKRRDGRNFEHLFAKEYSKPPTREELKRQLRELGYGAGDYEAFWRAAGDTRAGRQRAILAPDEVVFRETGAQPSSPVVFPGLNGGEMTFEQTMKMVEMFTNQKFEKIEAAIESLKDSIDDLVEQHAEEPKTAGSSPQDQLMMAIAQKMGVPTSGSPDAQGFNLVG